MRSDSRLESIAIRHLKAPCSGDVAADSARTVEAGACAPIAQKQAVSLVVAGNACIIVMRISFTAIPHVGNGDHDVRRHRQFDQAVKPVALILTGVKVLNFVSECEAFVDTPFGIDNKNIGSYLSLFRMTFEEFVVHLVHIHEYLAYRAAPFLVDLNIEVVVVALSHVEKFWRRSVRSHFAKITGIVGEASDVAQIDLDFCSVFSAQSSFALEIVSELTLKGPFARCGLCGVWVERGQGIGMQIRENRHVVEESGGSAHRPLTAESHVLATFDLNKSAEAAA